MSFLTAEWRKLILFNYEVDPECLKKYLPAGTELDPWNGVHYISLIGFMFKNVRLLGVKIPFHVNFEEVNLRFYVKRQDGLVVKHGVVFIKEIVPRFMVKFIANTLYGENYECLPTAHSWTNDQASLSAEYSWTKGGRTHSIKARGSAAPKPIEPNSETEFITKHFWGYSKINDHKTGEYEITRPDWLQYPIIDHQVDVDFQLVYGNEFTFLNSLQPKSVMFAEGSPIAVGHGKTF